MYNLILSQIVDDLLYNKINNKTINRSFRKESKINQLLDFLFSFII